MIGLVLAAAGTGSRFGSDLPKQFTEFQGKPLYLHALERFSTFFSEGVVVVPEEWKDHVESQVQRLPYGDRLMIEGGGRQRQDSVGNGLERLSEIIDIVLVHDAARPFVSAAVISRVIDGARRQGACIPALPVSETIKEVQEDTVVRTLDRERLQLIQTPQGFARDLLKTAFDKAIKDGFYGSDEAMLVERLGMRVLVVPGEPENTKITWREDLGRLL